MGKIKEIRCRNDDPAEVCPAIFRLFPLLTLIFIGMGFNSMALFRPRRCERRTFFVCISVMCCAYNPDNAQQQDFMREDGEASFQRDGFCSYSMLPR